VLIAASTIGAILPQFLSFSNAAAAASELFEIIDTPSKLDPLCEEGLKPATCKGHIELKDLSFSYPSRHSVQVLKNLSLSIPANKTTALVGASGCGKSTLVGLLERWYEHESGSINLDGVDISRYNTRWLRSKIGLVQQVCDGANVRSLEGLLTNTLLGTCSTYGDGLRKRCEWNFGKPEDA